MRKCNRRQFKGLLRPGMHFDRYNPVLPRPRPSNSNEYCGESSHGSYYPLLDYYDSELFTLTESVGTLMTYSPTMAP